MVGWNEGGEVCACLLDESQGKTWQKLEDICGWRKEERSGCFLNRDRERWAPLTYIQIFRLQTVVWKAKQSFVCDIQVTPLCPLCRCFMQSTLILFGLACLKQILFVWFWDGVWLCSRLEASPSPSAVGWRSVWSEGSVRLSVTRSLDSLHMSLSERAVCVCGSCGDWWSGRLNS